MHDPSTRRHLLKSGTTLGAAETDYMQRAPTAGRCAVRLAVMLLLGANRQHTTLPQSDRRGPQSAADRSPATR